MAMAEISEAEFEWALFRLPLFTRIHLLYKFNALSKSARKAPSMLILSDCYNKLNERAELGNFMKRVWEEYEKKSGMKPPETAACPPAWERMDELRKAAEPLRAYLAKYGDPHTCVIVTQYGATETRDERRVLFQDERQRERAAQFERELQALTGNG